MSAANQLIDQSPSKRSATIHDVAALAGVSIATVSRVINRTSHVSAPVTARVQAAIGTLQFVPHAAARVLATKKTNTIGLILPEISGFYFSPLLHGIEEGIRQHGFDLLVHTTMSSQATSEKPTQKLGEHNTDGLLIYTASIGHDEILRLRQRGFPIVLLLQSTPADLEIPSVIIENKSGALKVINHLIDHHGRRRIAFLAGPENEEDSYWREQGYRAALSSHGIPIDPNLISIGGFDTAIAQKSVSEWISRGIQMDAIFTGDDDSAIGAITALQSTDLRVPEDIAIVGFDDIYISQYLSPPLTTVRVPIELAGFTAAQQLIHIINQEPVERRVLLPTELIIRRSCGCLYPKY